MEVKENTTRFITAYQCDCNGYFEYETSIMEVDGVPHLPKYCITSCPWGTGLKDEKVFYKWTDSGWVTEVIPTSAKDFIGVVISHTSRTAHDSQLRELIQKFAQEEGFRELRGPDLSWSIEAIPEKTPEEKKTELAAQIRMQRDQLMEKTDIYMFTDNYSKLSETQKLNLETYRQALRDIPQQSSFPEQIDWPVKPEWMK